MRKGNLQTLTLLFCLALPTLSGFSISAMGQTGTALNAQTCNPQTTLDFRFSSKSNGNDSTTLSNSYFLFLDRYGNDLNLTLTSFTFTSDSSVTGYVTGYNNVNTTIAAVALFQFTSGSNMVYVYVPFSSKSISSNPTASNNLSPDLIDLTNSYSLLSSNSLSSFNSNQTLTAFNFLDNTDYNQWYTSVIGTSTILISKFVYNINSVSTASSTSGITALSTLDFGSTVTTTGDKLCYASISMGNFQTHMRESVALWFVEIAILIYWLIYLFSDATNKSVFSKDRHKDNPWTTWSLYSISHLAHQEFFTRLLRLTVVMIQWSIQGVFIASIIAAQYTVGPSIIIWSAGVAWAATLIFPFLWGSIFHSKIYAHHLQKLQLRKKILTSLDKDKLKEEEEQIDIIEEKIYGYIHWFYSIVFIIFFICWPLTINRLQQLPRQYYTYQWYWLAAMGAVFVLEYFIMEPLLLLLFHNRELFKNRGGYYYEHRMGQIYQEISDLS